jgi:hypothetical protein
MVAPLSSSSVPSMSRPRFGSEETSSSKSYLPTAFTTAGILGTGIAAVYGLANTNNLSDQFVKLAKKVETLSLPAIAKPESWWKWGYKWGRELLFWGGSGTGAIIGLSNLSKLLPTGDE